jgi:hypothetical protein
MLSLKEMVSKEKKVRFEFYRDGALHYKTEDGFVFPVAVSDAGSATFGAEEKAMLMMRYIRKQLKVLEIAKQTQNIF